MVWFGGRNSQLLNRILDVLICDDLTICVFQGFLPYLTLLRGIKDSKGANLAFVDRLDFTRGI